MSPSSLAPSLAGTLAERASIWWDALRPDQREVAFSPFDTDDRRSFTYLPGPRPGLALADMDERQRLLALKVVAAGMSSSGADVARQIMDLDDTLRELERGAGVQGWERRNSLHYWFRLLGHPDAFVPWAFHVGGHHLCLHFTMAQGQLVSGTPQFFGANPAVVPSGPQQGLQVLSAEEQLARAFLASLDPQQRQVAIVSATAPHDIATRTDPVAEIGVVPRGLGYDDMDATQRKALAALMHHYLGRLRHDLGATAWKALVDEGLSQVGFAWLGDTEPGGPHYYAVTGASFLLEYDCVQDGANHVHTVWRDVRSDWGVDVLAEHYRAHTG